MPINRVSTASLYQQNLSDIGSVQMDLARLNRQISSGYKADTWDQLNGTVERVSGYQTKLDTIKNFTINNTTIKARLNTMDQSVTQLQDIAERFASLISQRRTASAGTAMNFGVQAQSMLDQIAQDLNVQIAGRYLFSGANTTTKPITQPMPSLTEDGVPDDNYYNGTSDILTARVSEAQEMAYGVTGDNPAFQNLIGAIKTAIAGDEQSNDALLSKSVDLINLAVKGLADVKTSIATNTTNLSNIEDQHATLKLYWEESLKDETSTDIAEASIKLAAHQTTLQATFQAFASLTKLKLTDYL